MQNSPRGVALVNPLASALQHYEEALLEDLAAGGARRPHAVSIAEPSADGGRRISWLVRCYWEVAKAARRRNDGVVLLWPVLGNFDIALLGLLFFARRRAVVMHDPVPLVRWSIGYGPISRWLARALGGRVEILSHSTAASKALEEQGFDSSRIRFVEHPVAVAAAVPESTQRTANVIRVLGQYKPDRDVSALVEIAASEWPAGTRFEIVGRGWPAVEGWAVRSQFVPDADFAGLLATSSVVVIPYRRFYQSGVAIRAIEAGTPVVGPRASVLHEMLGDSPWLAADDGDWVRAVKAATNGHSLQGGLHSEAAAYEHIRDRAIASWQGWLTGMNASSPDPKVSPHTATARVAAVTHLTTAHPPDLGPS